MPAWLQTPHVRCLCDCSWCSVQNTESLSLRKFFNRPACERWALAPDRSLSSPWVAVSFMLVGMQPSLPASCLHALSWDVSQTSFLNCPEPRCEEDANIFFLIVAQHKIWIPWLPWCMKSAILFSSLHAVCTALHLRRWGESPCLGLCMLIVVSIHCNC